MGELEDLIALQRERSLGDEHLVRLDERQFYVAHTDAERRDGTNTEDCGVHQWLYECSRPPGELGIHVAVLDSHEGDMSYGADPYLLIAVDDWLPEAPSGGDQ